MLFTENAANSSLQADGLLVPRNRPKVELFGAGAINHA
jgi:hypothetical protein